LSTNTSTGEGAPAQGEAYNFNKSHSEDLS